MALRLFRPNGAGLGSTVITSLAEMSVDGAVDRF
jgi:hypothetical protein